MKQRDNFRKQRLAVIGCLIFLLLFPGGLVVNTEKAETKEIISSVVREDCGTKTEILQEVNEAELLKAQLMANKLPAGTAASKVYSNEYEYIGCLGSAEWRGEIMEGQISGFATVFNRIESPEFPNSPYEVISQRNPRQFSPVGDNGLIYYGEGSMVTIDMVPEKTLEALDRAIAGEDPTEQLLKLATDAKIQELQEEGKTLKLEYNAYWEGGALFFMTPAAFKSFEDNVAVYITIDGHVFFRAWSL